MARVRTAEEVEEIKLREKIKLSLVRQQIDLNREMGHGGCPTARGKAYITSIFQKNGMLSITRPHLSLECQIRAHLNQKDMRNRKAMIYDPRLDETQIRQYCCSKHFKDKCPAYRRFIEETDSIIVKREIPGEAGSQHIAVETEPPAGPASPPSPSATTQVPKPK